jgi:hypothetical protein
MRWTTWAVAIGFGLLVSAASGLAADEQPSKWEFDVVPYAWIAGEFGTVDVKGHTFKVHTTLYDVFSLLADGDALGGAAYFGARYGRWSVFVDAVGAVIRNQSVTAQVPTQAGTLTVAAKAKLSSVLLDFAVGYRLGEWALPHRERPVALGVYLGTRYQYLGSKLDQTFTLGGIQRFTSVSSSFNAALPMIGVRWEVPLLDKLTLAFRGDVGGLPSHSALTWGLVGDVRYWLDWHPFGTKLWLSAGYRAVGFDREFGTNGSADIQQRGPITGLGNHVLIT